MIERKCCWLLLLISLTSFSQDGAEFTRDKEFYIKGNATVIGNSILGKSARKSFNKPDKSNDEFKMRYIDIDKDATTWSSSSATFSIPEDARIVYASLMWTATYNGEESGVRVKDDALIYKKLKDRAHNAQVVKLKLPNATYMDITGDLIYDGKQAKNRTVRSRAPYAYMADVTTALQGYYQGEITVANVAATQGKMNGGSSAGWLLYIVYEDDTQPFQYITTFYGLESIKKERVAIDFGSFRSSKDGELQTQITVGALEGDANLDKDQITIYNPKSKLFLPFGNKVRPPNNFFNSSITSGEKMVLDRAPNSKNTLGFDIAQVTIDKELNTILANSPEGVKMQFNTRGDHYFLFFTAFQTTVSETFYKEKDKTEELVIAKPITPAAYKQKDKTEEVVIVKPITPAAVKEIIVEKTATSSQSNEEKVLPKKEVPVYSKTAVKRIAKPSTSIPGIQSGFYIITNVFSVLENAKKWKALLRSKGYASDIFFRPEKGYHYVSIGNNIDPVIIGELLQRARKDGDLSKSWILKVNM